MPLECYSKSTKLTNANNCFCKKIAEATEPNRKNFLSTKTIKFRETLTSATNKL